MTEKLIRFNHVLRDAIQSLIGTNCSADEILSSYGHAHEIGTATIQTGGGTFFDIFAKKGRNEWEEVEKILTHFKERGIRQTALIRGDCLFGYRPQPYDVVHATVMEYAKMGMNVLLNFHGLNDVRVLEGVAKAAAAARAQGFDIITKGTICIEDNPNNTIESSVETAQALIDCGHEGFYLKSASGFVKSEFVRELVGALIDKFPEQDIDVHVHSTYGEAPICYLEAIEAAIERNHSIGVDVQHPAMAGSTAHPNMLKILSLIQGHPNETIRGNAPDLNVEAISADKKALLSLRFLYRNFESSYEPKLLKAMELGRAPGGATSTLKSIPGLVENLSNLMEKSSRKRPTWNDIQEAIYKTQKRILPALGEPTQVTPYALNTTLQAASSLTQELMGKNIFNSLSQETMEYLAGTFGRVPETVDKDLQARALEKLGLDAPVEYVPSHLRSETALDAVAQELANEGLKNPSLRQQISAAMIKGGVKHVVACSRGENKPVGKPVLPDYADSNIVEALGGVPALEMIAQQALFLRQLNDGLNPFPKGLEWMRKEWHENLSGKLVEFMTSVPKKLEEYFKTHSKFPADIRPILVKAGCPEFADKKLSSASVAFGLEQARDILRDVMDHRSPGLFDYTLDQISPPRIFFMKNENQNGHRPSPV